MARMKWHDEIEVFKSIIPCIVLEGNVLDRFHYMGEPTRRMRTLPSYLLKMFSDYGYDIVSYYDTKRGFYEDRDRVGIDIPRIIECCSRVSYINPSDKEIACPFISVPEKPQLSEILAAVLTQTERPSAIIMDMASRYIVSPDQMDKCDVDAFTDLLRVIRIAGESILSNGESTRNIVLLIVNKINDLPVWFYLDNPDVKAIQVNTPDTQARLEFVSGENLREFFAPEIWKKEAPTTEADFLRVKKLQKKFVGMTEGFTFTDLKGMRTLCESQHYHIAQLPNVVEFYRYGIKENKWAQVDKDTVSSLEKDLYSSILGQDHALRKVMDVVKRCVVQKNGGNRPKGVLFFAGPTGTGKTETAKRLAKNIFGDTSCCIRFDMSEYRQDQSDQKLLGAPPGYVGYEAGGQLTNAVKKNPFSILLFDEIEKAHPSILDKFLQILDDGRLTDGQGNTVYFSESIIIFTSNKGIIEEVQSQDNYGLITTKKDQIVDPEKDSPKDVQQKVVDSISNYFKYSLGRPELLNRIGENNIIVYDFIRPKNSGDDGPDVVKGILTLQIDSCIEAIKGDNDIVIVVNAQAESVLYKYALEKRVLENGGRGIRNLVESKLFTPLTRLIYDKDLNGSGCRIEILDIMCNDTDEVELKVCIS